MPTAGTTNRFIGVGRDEQKYQLFNLVNIGTLDYPDLKFTFKGYGVVDHGAVRQGSHGFEITYHRDGATHFKSKSGRHAKGRKVPLADVRNPFIAFQIIGQDYATLPKYRGDLSRHNIPLPLHQFPDGFQVDVYLHSSDVPTAAWFTTLASDPIFVPAVLTSVSIPQWRIAITAACHKIDPQLVPSHGYYGLNAVGIPSGIVSYVPAGSPFAANG